MGVDSRDEGKHTGRNYLLFVEKMMWMDERVWNWNNWFAAKFYITDSSREWTFPRAKERKFHSWNFCSREQQFLGAKRPGTKATWCKEKQFSVWNMKLNNARPAKSHASRVRLAHFRWVSRSHSARWKSHAFSCSTKNNIFNVTSVLLLLWEMRILTPVLLLLTLGLLIFMCGSIKHSTVSRLRTRP